MATTTARSCALIRFSGSPHNGRGVVAGWLPCEACRISVNALPAGQTRPIFPGDQIANQELEADDAFPSPASWHLYFRLYQFQRLRKAAPFAAIVVPVIFSSAVA
ncbi:hypothetical protein ACFSQT_08225 [Mesorhizobium calcicola]|uniref:Uncharacterized protein n=1 Tax=Mesorhizobium calcicola TaxID=1300310 RepID=A0ABW4WAS8_9HYPH